MKNFAAHVCRDMGDMGDHGDHSLLLRLSSWPTNLMWAPTNLDAPVDRSNPWTERKARREPALGTEQTTRTTESFLAAPWYSMLIDADTPPVGARDGHSATSATVDKTSIAVAAAPPCRNPFMLQISCPTRRSNTTFPSSTPSSTPPPLLGEEEGEGDVW